MTRFHIHTHTRNFWFQNKKKYCWKVSVHPFINMKEKNCHKNEEFFFWREIRSCTSNCTEKRSADWDLVLLLLHRLILEKYRSDLQLWNVYDHDRPKNRFSFQVDGREHVCFYFFSLRFFWRFRVVVFLFLFWVHFLLPLKTVLWIFVVCTVLFQLLNFFLLCSFFLSWLFFFAPFSYSVPQSYVYGSPYLGAATTASAAGLVPIPATQLSHAAAIAAATNQFYEYQVSVQSYLVGPSYMWRAPIAKRDEPKLLGIKVSKNMFSVKARTMWYTVNLQSQILLLCFCTANQRTTN